MNMENTEDCEFIQECVMCLNKSITYICKECQAILRKNGIVNVATKEDYENFYLSQVDDHIQKKVSQQIQQNNI
jgi:type IV secretory pathway VirB4 component